MELQRIHCCRDCSPVTKSKKTCPTWWHVPLIPRFSRRDWQILVCYSQQNKSRFGMRGHACDSLALGRLRLIVTCMSSSRSSCYTRPCLKTKAKNKTMVLESVAGDSLFTVFEICDINPLDILFAATLVPDCCLPLSLKLTGFYIIYQVFPFSFWPLIQNQDCHFSWVIKVSTLFPPLLSLSQLSHISC